MWDAFAIGVHLPEEALRRVVALLGGLAVPSGSFDVILRDTRAGVVHLSEGVLRLGLAGLSTSVQVGD